MKIIIIIIIILISLCFNNLNACDSYVIEDNGKIKVFTSGDPISCDNNSEKFILKQKIIYCDKNKNKKSIKKDCKKSINEYKEIMKKQENKNWFLRIFG